MTPATVSHYHNCTNDEVMVRVYADAAVVTCLTLPADRNQRTLIDNLRVMQLSPGSSTHTSGVGTNMKYFLSNFHKD